MVKWGVSSKAFRVAVVTFGKLCLIACAGSIVIALTFFQQSFYIDGRPNYRFGLGAISTTFLVSFAAAALRLLELQFEIISPPTLSSPSITPPPPPLQKE